MKKIFLFSIVFVHMIFGQDQIIKKGNVYYLSNTVIVKLKSDLRVTEGAIPETMNKNLKGLKVNSARQTFKTNSALLKKGESGLSRIFTLRIDSQTDPLEASKKISRLKEIEWAEPRYIRKVTVVPPDDSAYVKNLQKNLQRINALKAWDITTGDTSVVIAVVDTGVDWKHPDLAANIFINNNPDPTFPNDVHGWDFGGLDGAPDNDPTEDKSPDWFGRGYHGTLVAGIACAVTNNKIGIASIGYSCSILPVKVSRSDRRDDSGNPYVYYGFEGIKYAADKGAKVINCSWGGYSYSRAEQETIDYAVSKGALVVAAAGNEDSNDLFYPASYKGVLSVGWLNTDNDTRSSAANYNTMVDVMAPGTEILTTVPTIKGGDLYNDDSGGSSLSSPLVAGLAGLVFSHFPNYTPFQIAERIRATCDYEAVYNANPADSVKYMLGRGRVNAYRALSETNPVSVRATTVEFIEEGNNNGLLESDESASIAVTFTNFLSSISNVKVSLACSDPAVSIVDSIFYTGALSTLDSVKNNSIGFKFSVVPNGPYNHTVNFLLLYSGEGYSDFQWVSTRVNPTFDNLNSNNIELTITSKGVLGFNDYSDNLEGVGLKYKNQDNVLFEGALMYGTGQDKLMDAARFQITQSADFQMLVPVKVNTNPEGDQFGSTVFNDDGGGISKLGIRTQMFFYGYTSTPNDNFIIVRTKFHNTTQTNINGFYAGYYFDFDMPGDDYSDDMVGYDNDDNFGYAYDLDDDPQDTYIGAALISSDAHGFYAINQDSTTDEVTPNSSDGFNDNEKWFAISNGIKKLTAGPADISFVISGGPFNINAGDSIDAAFALAGGTSVEEVRAAVRQSRIKWQNILTDIYENNIELPKEFALYQNYPNPFNPETIISYQLPVESRVSLVVYDVLGREVVTLVDEHKQAGIYHFTFNTLNSALSTGIYFYRLKTDGFSQTKKMILLK